MRIGLMGAGSVADFGHAPAIRAVEGLELAAIYDPTPGKAATFAHNHGSPLGTDDLSAFFAANLDAVTIASPQALTYKTSSIAPSTAFRFCAKSRSRWTTRKR